MTAEIDAGISAGAALSVGRMPGTGLRPALDGGRYSQARLDAADRWISGRPVTAVVGSNGIAVMLLDGPSLGYQWTIRLVVISAVDAMTTAVQGVGYIYAGTTGGGNLVPGNVRWGMPNLPNIANWGSDQLVLQYGEQLPCQVTGGTPGQVVQASYAYQLYRPGRRSVTEE